MSTLKLTTKLRSIILKDQDDRPVVAYVPSDKLPENTDKVEIMSKTYRITGKERLLHGYRITTTNQKLIGEHIRLRLDEDTTSTDKKAAHAAQQAGSNGSKAGADPSLHKSKDAKQ